MKKYIEEDLKSLYDNNRIVKADLLNSNIKKANERFKPLKDVFCSNMEPMYFTGDIKAKTIMIMLNPGGEDMSFNFSDEKYKYSNYDEYISSYINHHKNYGQIDFDRLDNFDLKQAAFLYHFKDSGVEIPNLFWNKNKTTKKVAKRNVLMQKLQLELIPYPSRTFSGLFGSIKSTKINLGLIYEHVSRLFENIVSFEREHILFCSKQHYNIFKVINDSKDIDIQIEIGGLNTTKIGNMNLGMYNIKVYFNNHSFKAKIICSFASQALPNAYEKMSNYGKFCYEVENNL